MKGKYILILVMLALVSIMGCVESGTVITQEEFEYFDSIEVNDSGPIEIIETSRRMGIIDTVIIGNVIWVNEEVIVFKNQTETVLLFTDNTERYIWTLNKRYSVEISSNELGNKKRISEVKLLN